MKRNWLLFLGAVLLFFLAGEGILRLLALEPFQANDYVPPQGLFCRPDPILGWAGKANAKGTYHFPEPDMEDMRIRLNAEGFWDPPHARTKPSHIRRVLFLGDSFTAGYGIPREARFTSLVEQSLGDSFEAINMGVWGYSLGQELLVLEDKGLAYDPDAVVLSLFMDDLFCAHLFSVNEGRYLKPKYRIRQGALELVNHPLSDYRTRSLFWNFLVARYYELRNRLEVGGTFMRSGWLSVMDRHYAEQGMFTLPLLLVAQIHDLCRSREVDFLLVVIPDVDQLSARDLMAAGEDYMHIPADRLDLLLPQKVLKAYCRKSGIPVLDLLPFLMRQPDPRNLYFQKDLHWTRRGHGAAAKAISADLNALSAMPRSP